MVSLFGTGVSLAVIRDKAQALLWVGLMGYGEAELRLEAVHMSNLETVRLE